MTPGELEQPEPMRPEGYDLWPELIGVGHAQGPPGPSDRPIGFLWPAPEPELIIVRGYRPRA